MLSLASLTRYLDCYVSNQIDSLTAGGEVTSKPHTPKGARVGIFCMGVWHPACLNGDIITVYIMRTALTVYHSGSDHTVWP